MDDFDERSAFFSRRTDKAIVGRQFPGGADVGGAPMRIMSRIMQSGEGLEMAKVKDELVVRVTPSGRQMIKATFYEDSRNITVLTVQRFTNDKPNPTGFSFVGQEITTLKEFIAGVDVLPLPTKGKRDVNDEELREILLDRSQLGRVLAKNPEGLAAALQSESVSRDLQAIGYRRAQLKHFERLLNEPTFFDAEKTKANKTPEALWQQFFEANKWIFGYGLAYQFLSGLDGKTLEQAVSGFSLTGPGKEADAVMKTQGLINSLCLVEIKRHDTPLLAKETYRSGAWAPHAEVVGGVAQVQATVQAAAENIRRKLEPIEDDGTPTGEEPLFNYDPRAFLVVGSLSQFKTDTGINEQKFRSFELFRRNTRRPEILTFDELYERARFIVEHAD